MSRSASSQYHQVQKVTFRKDRRGPCSWILNFLWLALGGWHMFLSWFLLGLAFCATCIGIPCGWQMIKIACFLLFPFGKTLVYTHQDLDESGQCCFRGCDCILNFLWAVTAGWILALQAFLTGIILMFTIVGIPFGIQCFKLMVLCFCPFGIDFSADQVETVIINAPISNNHNYQAMGV